ncbi:MAG: hypothetical protein WC789_02245 [Lentisphaeria bacterium]|jgi:hypothetical protein
MPETPETAGRQPVRKRVGRPPPETATDPLARLWALRQRLAAWGIPVKSNAGSLPIRKRVGKTP